jgi:hypothetical protein
MNTSYFQGRDGFIWWNGVVEDRQDPLFLGRCKVRILGWHTEDKSELPTASLPWAQVLMPVTSASQTNVGHAPVGPVEGTWVMGFYRDGELAQEPVMMGTIPGIPENFAKQGTGFNDPRLDIPTGERMSSTADGTAKIGIDGESLDAFPYPPKDIKTISGGEAIITPYSDLDRKSILGSRSLYPREVDRPTTSKYARGSEDSSSFASTVGIIADKNKNTEKADVTIPAFSPSTVFIPKGEVVIDSVNSTARIGKNDYLKSDDYYSLRKTTVTKSIVQPSSAYAAVYPFNHVYESESGHLIEQDDTPGKERLHWYHRSGTFTEFHPKGMRVDKTNVGGRLTLKSSKDMSIVSQTGNIVIDSEALNTYIGGNNIILDAKNTLILRGGSQIIREDDTAEDKVRGNLNLAVGASYGVRAGSVSLTSGIGALNLTSGGAMQSMIAGNSEESIVNKDYIFGNIFGKKITAINGMIGLESVGLIPLSGGISLNVGLLGAFGHTHILPTGDILINSVLGVAGVTTSAPIGNITQLAGLVASMIGTAGTIVGSSASPTSIDGVAIQVGGTSASEPAMLGTAFLKLFTKHTHPSSVGPTGPLSPEFASELISVVSKKVFLAA